MLLLQRVGATVKQLKNNRLRLLLFLLLSRLLEQRKSPPQFHLQMLHDLRHDLLLVPL
jgi:hypothetical protein